MSTTVLQTFKAIKDQTPELCMAAVQLNGLALEYVHEQTLELCVEAVKQTKKAFKYTEFQTKQMCWDALREERDYYDRYPGFGHVVDQRWGNERLQYVLNQTEDMCLYAVVLPPYPSPSYDFRYPLEDVKEQTEEICMASVRAYPESLEFVKNQTPKICMAALDALKKRNAPTVGGSASTLVCVSKLTAVG